MKRVRLIRVDSPNGEIHFVLQEHQLSDRSENIKDFGEVDAKRITKKEATKPLILVREE